MKNLLKQKESFVLILILIFALILRFINYCDWSLSNDELSALNRLRYDNLKDLVKYGAMINDMHPAGVQVFLFYWNKIFGLSEASIRLPFVLAGIISVYITYLIAKKWFNNNVGLLASATIAVLQFPILYSQLARPYSPGLLFSLLTVLFFTYFFWGNINKRILNYVGFILSFTFAAYSHHFSFLFVIMVWVTGLVFLNKSNWKLYLSMPFVIFILYLPNLKIFIYQFFGKGGLGGADGWLGKPDNNFILKYLYYSLNESYLIVGLILLSFIASIVLNYKSIKVSKFQFISISWFVVHFLVGFLYSKYFNPILQYSILIFSFPFLLIFMFSFVSENKLKLNIVAVFLILIIGTFNTAYTNNFYNTKPFSDFKSVAYKIIDLNKKYGYSNITRTINCTAPYYIDYYFLKKNEKASFVKYKNTGGEDLFILKEILKDCKTPYFLNSSTNADAPEVEDIIMTKYPYIIEHEDYTYSKVTLYSKIKISNSIKRQTPVFDLINSFENETDFGYDSTRISKNFVEDGLKSFIYDSIHEYGPTFRIKYSEIAKDIKVKSYKISLSFYSDVDITDAHIVFQIESDKKSKEWRANQFKFFNEKGKWNKAFLNSEFPKMMSDNDEIAIYVWNPKKEKFYIDNLEIRFYKEKLFFPW